MSRLVITPRLLQQALRIPAQRALRWADVLEMGAQLAEVESDLELAHFLAQIGHETGQLVYTREVWGPTSAQIRYERRFDAPWPTSFQQSRTSAFAANRLAFALGNHKAGDGKRYMGRGFLQTTGRGNYLVLTDRLKDLVGEDSPDLVTAPMLLQEPPLVSLSAGQYWLDKKIKRLAEADDILAVTKRINGGTNGLAHRQLLTTTAKLAIMEAHDAT